MLFYCLKCGKNTESKIAIVVEWWRTMLLSKCEACDTKNLTLIKKQEASGLLSSLGINTPSSKASLVGPLLF